jgi:chromodomain-helicase-DNA-binding protein 4
LLIDFFHDHNLYIFVWQVESDLAGLDDDDDDEREEKIKKKRGRSGKKSGTAGGSSKKSTSKVPTLKIKLGKRKRGSSVRV